MCSLSTRSNHRKSTLRYVNVSRFFSSCPTLAYCRARGVAVCRSVCEKLAHVLSGHSFIVETDYKNLELFWKLASFKCDRWWRELSAFNISFVHIAGTTMGLPETLSRVTCSVILSGQPSYFPVEVAEVLDLVHNPISGMLDPVRCVENQRLKAILGQV
jgi:hypothetical protein